MATKLMVFSVDEGIALGLRPRESLQAPKQRSFLDVLMSMPNVGEDADFDRLYEPE